MFHRHSEEESETKAPHSRPGATQILSFCEVEETLHLPGSRQRTVAGGGRNEPATAGGLITNGGERETLRMPVSQDQVWGLGKTREETLAYISRKETSSVLRRCGKRTLAYVNIRETSSMLP